MLIVKKTYTNNNLDYYEVEIQIGPMSMFFLYVYVLD